MAWHGPKPPTLTRRVARALYAVLDHRSPAPSAPPRSELKYWREAEVFEFFETSGAHVPRQFYWIEMADPRLPDRRRAPGDFSQFGSAFRLGVLQGLEIVEHDHRLWHTSHEVQRLGFGW